MGPPRASRCRLPRDGPQVRRGPARPTPPPPPSASIVPLPLALARPWRRLSASRPGWTEPLRLLKPLREDRQPRARPHRQLHALEVRRQERVERAHVERVPALVPPESVPHALQPGRGVDVRRVLHGEVAEVLQRQVSRLEETGGLRRRAACPQDARWAPRPTAPTAAAPSAAAPAPTRGPESGVGRPAVVVFRPPGVAGWPVGQVPRGDRCSRGRRSARLSSARVPARGPRPARRGGAGAGAGAGGPGGGRAGGPPDGGRASPSPGRPGAPKGAPSLPRGSRGPRAPRAARPASSAQ